MGENMKSSEKCTILVNSCDAYSDIWDLFFESIRVQWPDCPYKIVLNTQEKEYVYKDMHISVHHCNVKGKQDRWGERFRKTLDDIDTPYVLPMLEDFVLNAPAKNAKLIQRVIEWMDSNPKVSVFYLHVHPSVMPSGGEYPGFGLLPQSCDYRLTTAIGVWRKDRLRQHLRDFETAWEWEVNGSKRASRYVDHMYAIVPEHSEMEVFSFPYGGVVRRGLWHTDILELVERYGVEMDLNNRDFFDPEDPFRYREIYSLRKNFPGNMIQKIFWKTIWDRMRKKIRYIRSMI